MNHVPVFFDCIAKLDQLSTFHFARHARGFEYLKRGTNWQQNTPVVQLGPKHLMTSRVLTDNDSTIDASGNRASMN